MRVNSLAFRLISFAAGWSVIVLVVTGVILSSLFARAVERNFDLRLQAYLKGLIANTEQDEKGALSQGQALGETRFEIPYSGLYWKVTEVGGEETDALTSRSLFEYKLTSPSELGVKPDAQSLRRATVDGPEGQRLRMIERDVRLPELDRTYAFLVAGDMGEVAIDVSSFNNTLFIALSILAFGLVLAAFVQVRFGLQPLRRFREALAHIRAGKQERLEGEFPIEIKPVAEELNELLQANEDVVGRARTHVGNLAHALKTPLSVITNEAQDTSSALANKVREQAILMGDHINLYLDRARMAAGGQVLGAVCDIEPVSMRLVRALRKIYAEKSLKLEADVDASLKFRGEQQDLEEMLGNLIDNACKWANSRVRISAQALVDKKTREQVMEIIVDDDGPGLAPARRKGVLKRGRRLDESKPGSGLGLAIASELAAAYGGIIQLQSSPLKGLRARIVLPRT